MAITINGVDYDEADLDNNVKNSIRQVQNANANIANLQADLLNQQIIAQHHSKLFKITYLKLRVKQKLLKRPM